MRGPRIFLIFSGLLTLFFLFCLISPPKANATSSSLVINEISPSPISGEKEWVEIYNLGGLDIDLVDYGLKDGAVAVKNLSNVSLIIQDGGYFVFEANSGWLNNPGDTLSLIYKPTSTTIDQLTYGNWNDNQANQPPAPSSGKSLSRIPNGFDSDVDKNDFRIVASSKGGENLLPVYSNMIIINEICPQPANGAENEYIELFNTGADIVDLSDWQLDDISSGGSSPYTIPQGTTIAPSGFILFYNSTDNLALNDSGDSVRLLDPNGDLKSEINYSSAISGQSYSYFSDGWHWTTLLTPGLINQLMISNQEVNRAENPVVITIAEAKNHQVDDTVTIIGRITVPPGVLSDQYFYLEDDSGGIQVYSYYKLWPKLTIGDRFQITGILSLYHGEYRLKTSSLEDFIFIDVQTPPPPTNLTSTPTDPKSSGSLVTFSGSVVSNDGSTVTLNNNGVEIKVYILDHTDIKKPKIKKGDTLEVTGILSYYNDSFRILPRYQNDIIVIKVDSLPVAGEDASTSLNIFGLMIPLTLNYLKWNETSSRQFG